MRMSYRKMNNLFPGMLALFVAVLILFFSQPVRAQWNFDDGTKQGWAGGGGRFDEFFWCWDDYVSYPYFPYDDVGNSHGSISFQLHATPEEPLANPSQDYHLKMYSPYFGNTEWDNAIGFTAKFLWLGNFNQTFHLNSNIRPEIYYIDQNGVKRELGGISDPSNTVWYDIESYWEDNTTAIRIQFEWNVQEEDLVGAYGGFFYR